MPFKVTKEQKSHFECEGAGGKFKIAKKGLHPKHVAHLQKLAQGGYVSPDGPSAAEEPEASMPAVPEEIAQTAPHFQDGPQPGPTIPQAAMMAGRAMIPVPARGSLGARGVAALNSILPGGRSYGEELDAYNAGAPGNLEAASNLATTLIPGEKLAGAAYGLAKGAKKVGAVVRDAKAARGLAGIKWGDLSFKDALATAELGKHLITNKAGTYVGAPPGITPENIEGLRAHLDGLVDRGLAGADAYVKHRSAISAMTGGDYTKGDQASRLIAIYSPQSTQESNLVFATRDWNKHARGVDLTADPTRKRSEAAAAQKMFEDSDSKAGLGLKTGRYSNASNPTLGDEPLALGANDTWMARAFGYQGQGAEGKLTKSQHAFMNGELLLAMKRAHGRGVLASADMDGVPPVQAAIWRAMRDEAGAPGGTDIMAALPRVTANETTSAIPGAASGHLAGLPPEGKEALAADPRSTDLDPQGYDRYWKAAGAMQLPAERMPGEWGNAAEPNTVLHPLVVNEKGPKKGTPGKRGPRNEAPLDPDSAAMMQTVNRTRSVMDAQEVGGWNFPGRQTAEPATAAWMDPSVPSGTNRVPWSPEDNGQVTRWMFEGADPATLANLDRGAAGAELRESIGSKNALAEELSRRFGAMPRESLMRLRSLISEKGFLGAQAWAKEHGYEGLPAMLAGVGAGAGAAATAGGGDSEYSAGGMTQMDPKKAEFVRAALKAGVLSPATAKKVQEHLARGGEVHAAEAGYDEGAADIPSEAEVPEAEMPAAPEAVAQGSTREIPHHRETALAPGAFMNLNRDDAPPTPGSQADVVNQEVAQMPPTSADDVTAPAAPAEPPPDPYAGFTQSLMTQFGGAGPRGRGKGGGGVFGIGKDPAFPPELKDIQDTATTAIDSRVQYEKDAAQSAYDAQNAANAAMQTTNQRFMNMWQEELARSDKIYQDTVNAKIDPNRFWATRTTGQRISASIGMLLGGYAQAFGAGPNPAMALIDKAIDRDIDAQKTDIANKQFLLNYHLAKGHDILQAKQMAKADIMDLAAGQITAAGYKLTGQTAQANADLAKSDLRMRAYGIREDAMNQSYNRALEAERLRLMKIQTDTMGLQWQLALAGSTGQAVPGALINLMGGEGAKDWVNIGNDRWRKAIPGEAQGYRQTQVLSGQLMSVLDRMGQIHTLGLAPTEEKETLRDLKTEGSNILRRMQGTTRYSGALQQQGMEFFQHAGSAWPVYSTRGLNEIARLRQQTKEMNDAHLAAILPGGLKPTPRGQPARVLGGPPPLLMRPTPGQE